jgi:hypothetical protein
MRKHFGCVSAGLPGDRFFCLKQGCLTMLNYHKNDALVFSPASETIITVLEVQNEKA